MENQSSPDQTNTTLARIVVVLAVCVLVSAAVVAYLWLRPVSGAQGAKEIAYVAIGTDGNLDLFLADAAGRRITQLTKTTDDELYPAWSPDGKSLAYVRAPLRAAHNGGTLGADTGIYLMNFEGESPRERAMVPSGASGIGVPSWSPDGRRIAFLSPVVPGPAGGALSGDLNIVNVSSRAVQTIPVTVTVRAMDLPPSWSPDGSAVAFIAPRDVITVASGNTSQLSEELQMAVWVYSLSDRALSLAAPEASMVAWSPAGDWLAYAGGMEGGVHLVRPDGTGDRTLLDRATALSIAWSPDGSRIAATGWAQGEEEPGLGIISVADGAISAFPMGDTHQVPQFPAWSPDGAYVSVSLFSDSGGTIPDAALWIVEAGSGAQFAFPDSPGMEALAVWRPVGD